MPGMNISGLLTGVGVGVGDGVGLGVDVGVGLGEGIGVGVGVAVVVLTRQLSDLAPMVIEPLYRSKLTEVCRKFL
jgi:hypothetical protein